MKKNIIATLIILLYTFLTYYISLPALNLSAPSFWLFIIQIMIIILIVFNIVNTKLNTYTVGGVVKIDYDKSSYSKGLSVFNKIFGLGLLFIISGILLMNLVLSPIFNSKSYASRINVEDGEFKEDIKEVDFNKLPLLDKDSTSKLGDRTMGEMPDLVSQFTVSNLYTQINYNDEILRVTPLEYDGMVKYFTNKHEGVKGYITVNSVNGDANLVKLDKGMKYLPSAMFGEDLKRKLVFDNPTKIFGEANFEIDEEGNPYWVVQTIKYSGVGLKKDISGVVLLNAITGESKYYDADEVPSWVDRVYSADLVINQIDNWGTYVNGFINSIFGQKNVVNTTEGYNYLKIDEDIYLYTGITSVLADESNLGFMLVNLRTKESKYYSVSGAEEFSAMSSAEGLVQEKEYVASFPLLINLEGRPTYLLSLKDAAGLVKMYAFVDVSDYQIVSTTDSSLGIIKAKEEYLSKISNTSANTNLDNKDITIKEILNATLNGNSIYYFIDNNDNKYQVNINVNDKLIPFIKVGDTINIEYIENKVSVIKRIK